MGRRRNISAVISMKDNMSATLRSIRREQTAFRAEVTRTRNELKHQQHQANRAIDVRFNTSRLGRAMGNMRQRLAPLRRRYIVHVAAREIRRERRQRLVRSLRRMGRTVVSPIVKIKDKVSKPLGKIKKSIMSLKGLAVAAGVGAASKALLSAGATLEQQKISMKHFMGAGNKGKSGAEISKMSDSYLKNLRNNANATPFETGEVIAAGTRSLQISGGDSKSALKMVKLAEDMAAMNPGKTVSDAMEAIADAKNGEMERLKEFGVKASSKDSFEKVQGQLQGLYEGGATKLASSGLGLWSTITGKLKSSVADTGLNILEGAKPALEGFIGFIDTAMPTITSVGSAIGSGIGGAVTFIQGQMPILGPIFQGAFNSVKTIVVAVSPIIGQVVKALWPVFLKLGQVVVKSMGVVANIVKAVAPVVSSLLRGVGTVIKGVANGVRTMGQVFTSIFEGIKTTVQNAYNFIKPLIEGIKTVTSGIGNGISAVASFVTGNATGTQYWDGGVSLVGEHGPELVEMPRGAKVHTNSAFNYMAKRANKNKDSYLSQSSQSTSVRQTSNKTIINIAKLAETFEIKDKRDIKVIVEELIRQLRIASVNYAG